MEYWMVYLPMKYKYCSVVFSAFDCLPSLCSSPDRPVTARTDSLHLPLPMYLLIFQAVPSHPTHNTHPLTAGQKVVLVGILTANTPRDAFNPYIDP